MTSDVLIQLRTVCMTLYLFPQHKRVNTISLPTELNYQESLLEPNTQDNSSHRFEEQINCHNSQRFFHQPAHRSINNALNSGRMKLTILLLGAAFSAGKTNSWLDSDLTFIATLASSEMTPNDDSIFSRDQNGVPAPRPIRKCEKEYAKCSDNKDCCDCCDCCDCWCYSHILVSLELE